MIPPTPGSSVLCARCSGMEPTEESIDELRALALVAEVRAGRLPSPVWLLPDTCIEVRTLRGGWPRWPCV